MMVDGFTFFKSFYTSLQHVSDSEFREIVNALCKKAFFDEEASLEGYPAAMFELMLPNLENSIAKRESGKKGGKAKSEVLESKNESACKQNEECLKAKSEVLESNKEKEKEKEEDKDKEKNKDIGVEEGEEKKRESLKDIRFADFWAAYPKKVGKKEAYKAWGKAKVTDEIFHKILDTIDRQKRSDQWRKNNGQFIPNPSTWLNQGRWDDEVGQSANDALMEIIEGGGDFDLSGFG